MASLKPAYLIHGDDHGAIAERRRRLRALAEADGAGAVAIEALDGQLATPGGLASALATMTLGSAQGAGGALERVILVDGVERWAEAEIQAELAPAMAAIPAGTTVALFAHEESRAKVAPALADAVERAGGQVVAQMTVKPWELPGWTCARAAELGLALDSEASRALVAQVGERQQRLLRELEKLALELGDPAGEVRLSGEELERRAARSAEWRAYSLGDDLVGGRTREATLGYLRLLEQGERLQGLMYLIAQRFREALAVALRLQSGEAPAAVRKGLRMPPRAAQRFVAELASADPVRLRRALVVLADLELDARGGAVLAAARSGDASLGEDTLAVRAIERICA